MNKVECEQLLIQKLLEIQKIYKEYHPDGDYLTLHISNIAISINNAHWAGGKDSDHPINVFELKGDLENEIQKA